MTGREEIVLATGRCPGHEQRVCAVHRVQTQVGQALPQATALLHVQRARGDGLVLLVLLLLLC